MWPLPPPEEQWGPGHWGRDVGLAGSLPPVLKHSVPLMAGPLRLPPEAFPSQMLETSESVPFHAPTCVQGPLHRTICLAAWPVLSVPGPGVPPLSPPGLLTGPAGVRGRHCGLPSLHCGLKAPALLSCLDLDFWFTASPHPWEVMSPPPNGSV